MRFDETGDLADDALRTVEAGSAVALGLKGA
jgi:hypothetical protein